MTYPITVLIVPVEGPIRTETIESANTALDAFQKIVGGYIEPIPLPTGDSAFINEDGKDRALPENPRATTALAAYLFLGDYIAGDLVVVGPPDADGETTSADLESAQSLFGQVG